MEMKKIRKTHRLLSGGIRRKSTLEQRFWLLPRARRRRYPRRRIPLRPGSGSGSVPVVVVAVVDWCLRNVKCGGEESVWREKGKG